MATRKPTRGRDNTPAAIKVFCTGCGITYDAPAGTPAGDCDTCVKVWDKWQEGRRSEALAAFLMAARRVVNLGIRGSSACALLFLLWAEGTEDADDVLVHEVFEDDDVFKVVEWNEREPGWLGGWLRDGLESEYRDVGELGAEMRAMLEAVTGPLVGEAIQ